MVLNDGVSNTPISKTAQSAGQLQLPGPELQVCTKVDLVRDWGLPSVSCGGWRHSSTLVLDGEAVLTEFLI